MEVVQTQWSGDHAYLKSVITALYRVKIVQVKSMLIQSC